MYVRIAADTNIQACIYSYMSMSFNPLSLRADRTLLEDVHICTVPQIYHCSYIQALLMHAVRRT